MEYTDNGKVIFDNDDDFFDYAVNTTPVIKDGKTCKYFTFDFSDMYTKDFESGKSFIMKDPGSKYLKRGCVSYRTWSANVNLKYEK